MTDFSRPGDAPTATEIALAQSAVNDRVDDIRQRWLALAKVIGLHAVLLVMDEFGSEKIHVSTRQKFVLDLWRPHRDAQVRQLRAQEKLTLREMTERTALSERSVCRALKGG